MDNVTRVCLAFDVDGLSLLRAKRRLGIELSSDLAARLTLDQGEYFDRVLEFYDRFQIRQTLFIPGEVILSEPDRIRRAVRAGHEIGFHGHTHLPLDQLTDLQEAEEFNLARAALHTVAGVEMRGMRAPSYSFNARTPRNIARCGMLYDSSLIGTSAPYFVAQTGSGYWEITVPPDVDDWMHCVSVPELGYHHTLIDPAAVVQIYCRAFDRARLAQSCFATVFHPFVTMSDTYRTVPDALVTYIRSFSDIKFCTMAEIAADYAASTLNLT